MTDGDTSRDEELLAGAVCDGYRIVALIAAGGMGDVYEAVHEVSGKTVAVKCLKVRHRNKEDARARMKMEAVVLSELQHANLVQVYDAGVNDSGMVWIAMERLHGQTLREILHRGGALSIPDALYYASEIADGVDAVHEVNVIHRDLKPENVFVTTRKVVKVLDLGTGKFTGYGLNSTDRMRVLGTTAYMSPEQIKGLRVDARADVYALGLMVYEMIAGRHPLATDDGIASLPRAIEQVALMQLQMTPKPLGDLAPHCPGYIAAIVAKALCKDREQRYLNMTAFSRELRTSRKRFIAENGLDDSPVDLLAGGDRLREKFGAPPRPGSKPPPAPAKAAPAPVKSAREVDTAVDRGAAKVDSLKTEIQARPDFTAGGLTPVPAAYEPTIDISSSALPALPPDVARRSDLTDRVPPPDDVRNRTTHTNPLLVARAADLTPEPLSLPDPKRRSIFGWWAHPMIRRAAVTLGLGALIGIPPAIIGVVWARHRAPAVQVPAGTLAMTAPPEGPGRPTATASTTTTPTGTATTTATPTATATTTPTVIEPPVPAATAIASAISPPASPPAKPQPIRPASSAPAAKKFYLPPSGL